MNLKGDFLDKPNLIEEAQKINQIAMNYSRSTSGPASWTNPRTGKLYSVASGGDLALAKKIRNDNISVFGVLDLVEAVEGKQDILAGATSERPTLKPPGYMYFDTTLGKPIWYTGTSWIDSTGSNV